MLFELVQIPSHRSHLKPASGRFGGIFDCLVSVAGDIDADRCNDDVAKCDWHRSLRTTRARCMRRRSPASAGSGGHQEFKEAMLKPIPANRKRLKWLPSFRVSMKSPPQAASGMKALPVFAEFRIGSSIRKIITATKEIEINRKAITVQAIAYAFARLSVCSRLFR
jgi:hypothetical protein